MFHSTMPLIDTDKLASLLSPEDCAIAKLALVSRGKDKGRLKASSPKQPYKVPKGKRNEQGLAYYAWRMAALQVSPRGEHHCIPFMASSYLDGDNEGYDRARVNAAAAHGQAIADAIVACVPLAKHYGTRLWAHALYG